MELGHIFEMGCAMFISNDSVQTSILSVVLHDARREGGKCV